MGSAANFYVGTPDFNIRDQKALAREEILGNIEKNGDDWVRHFENQHAMSEDEYRQEVKEIIEDEAMAFGYDVNDQMGGSAYPSISYVYSNGEIWTLAEREMHIQNEQDLDIETSTYLMTDEEKQELQQKLAAEGSLLEYMVLWERIHDGSGQRTLPMAARQLKDIHSDLKK